MESAPVPVPVVTQAGSVQDECEAAQVLARARTCAFIHAEIAYAEAGGEKADANDPTSESRPRVASRVP